MKELLCFARCAFHILPPCSLRNDASHRSRKGIMLHKYVRTSLQSIEKGESCSNLLRRWSAFYHWKNRESELSKNKMLSSKRNQVPLHLCALNLGTEFNDRDFWARIFLVFHCMHAWDSFQKKINISIEPSDAIFHARGVSRKVLSTHFPSSSTSRVYFFRGGFCELMMRYSMLMTCKDFSTDIWLFEHEVKNILIIVPLTCLKAPAGCSLTKSFWHRRNVFRLERSLLF